MTRQELLTKLAVECETWETASFLGRAEACSQSQNDPSMSAVNITEKDWLAERERLLNNPSWDDAPRGATHKAMDANGVWFFYKLKPKKDQAASEWLPEKAFRGGGGFRASKAIAIPAGYDWRDSLEARPA